MSSIMVCSVGTHGSKFTQALYSIFEDLLHYLSMSSLYVSTPLYPREIYFIFTSLFYLTAIITGDLQELEILRDSITQHSIEPPFICLLFSYSPCSHIMYFNLAEFPIKLFSFTCFSVTIVRKWNRYEMVTETGPIEVTF